MREVEGTTSTPGRIASSVLAATVYIEQLRNENTVKMMELLTGVKYVGHPDGEGDGINKIKIQFTSTIAIDSLRIRLKALSNGKAKFDGDFTDIKELSYNGISNPFSYKWYEATLDFESFLLDPGILYDVEVSIYNGLDVAETIELDAGLINQSNIPSPPAFDFFQFAGSLLMGKLSAEGLGDVDLEVKLPTLLPVQAAMLMSSPICGTFQLAIGYSGDTSVGQTDEEKAEAEANEKKSFSEKYQEALKKYRNSGDSSSEKKVKGSITGYAFGTLDFIDGEWNLTFCGGGVKVMAGFSWEYSRTLLIGVVPVYYGIEVGVKVTADVLIAGPNEYHNLFKVQDDPTKSVSEEYVYNLITDVLLEVEGSVTVKAGVGFDLAVVALKLGVEGGVTLTYSHRFVNFINNGKTVYAVNGGEFKYAIEIKLVFEAKFLFWEVKYVIASASGDNVAGMSGSYPNGYWESFPEGRPGLESEASYSYAGASSAAMSSAITYTARYTVSASESDLDSMYPYAEPTYSDDGEMLGTLHYTNDNMKPANLVPAYGTKNNDGEFELTNVDAYKTIDTTTNLATTSVSYAGTKDFSVLAYDCAVYEDGITSVKQALENYNTSRVFATTIDGSGNQNTVKLSPDGQTALAPKVSVYNSKAVVVWQTATVSVDTMGNMLYLNQKVWYAYYDGVSWSDAALLDTCAAFSPTEISVAVDGNGTFVATAVGYPKGKTESTDKEVKVYYVDPIFGSASNTNSVSTFMLTDDEKINLDCEVVTRVRDSRYIFLLAYNEAIPTIKKDNDGYEYEQLNYITKLAMLDSYGKLIPSYAYTSSEDAVGSTFSFAKTADYSIENSYIVWINHAFSNNGDLRCAKVNLDCNGALELSSEILLSGSNAEEEIINYSAYYDASTGKVNALALQQAVSDSEEGEIIVEDSDGNFVIQKDAAHVNFCSGKICVEITDAELYVRPTITSSKVVPFALMFTNTTDRKMSGMYVYYGNTKYFASTLLYPDSVGTVYFNYTRKYKTTETFTFTPVFTDGTEGTPFDITANVTLTDLKMGTPTVSDGASGEKKITVTIANQGTAFYADSDYILLDVTVNGKIMKNYTILSGIGAKIVNKQIKISGSAAMSAINSGRYTLTLYYSKVAYNDNGVAAVVVTGAAYNSDEETLMDRNELNNTALTSLVYGQLQSASSLAFKYDRSDKYLTGVISNLLERPVIIIPIITVYDADGKVVLTKRIEEKKLLPGDTYKYLHRASTDGEQLVLSFEEVPLYAVELAIDSTLEYEYAFDNDDNWEEIDDVYYFRAGTYTLTIDLSNGKTLTKSYTFNENSNSMVPAKDELKIRTAQFADSTGTVKYTYTRFAGEVVTAPSYYDDTEYYDYYGWGVSLDVINVLSTNKIIVNEDSTFYMIRKARTPSYTVGNILGYTVYYGETLTLSSKMTKLVYTTLNISLYKMVDDDWVLVEGSAATLTSDGTYTFTISGDEVGYATYQMVVKAKQQYTDLEAETKRNFQIFCRGDISDGEASYTEEYAYTGSEITLQNLAVTAHGKYDLVEGKDYEVIYHDNVDVYYYSYGGDEQIGYTTATIRGIGLYVGSLTKSFKITPALYDLSAFKFENVVYTYDGNEHCPEVEGTLPDFLTVTYSVQTYFNNRYAPDSNKYASSYCTDDERGVGVYAKFTCSNKNYYLNSAAYGLDNRRKITKTAYMRIDKAVMDVSANSVEDATYDYDGTTRYLEIVNTLGSNVALLYYKASKNNSSAGEFAWGTTDLGVVNAGTYSYKVYYYLQGSYAYNYYEIEPMQATVKINKVELDDFGTVYNDATVTFDNTAKNIEYSFNEVTSLSGNGIGFISQTAARTSAGTYTQELVIGLADATERSNYVNGSVTYKATLTINKASLDVSGLGFENESYVYDGTEKVISLSGTENLPDYVSYTVVENKRTDVGVSNASVVFTIPREMYANYNSLSKLTATLTVTKATITLDNVEVEDKSVGYNGLYYYIPLMVDGEEYFFADGYRGYLEKVRGAYYYPLELADGVLPEGVSVYCSLCRKMSDANGSGYTYTYRFAIDKQENYEVIPDISATLIIAQKSYDLSYLKFDNTEYVYDGTEKSLELTGGELPEDVTPWYEYNTLTEVGTTTARVIFLVPANCAKIPARTATLTIVKATYNMDSVRFDSQAYDYSIISRTLLISGELPTGVSVSYTDNTLKNAGTLNVTASFTFEDTANYNLIPDKTATLTIRKLTYDMSAVTFANAAYDYSATQKAIAIGGTLPTDIDGNQVTVTYYCGDVEGNVFTNAGAYEVTAKFSGSSNYNAIEDKTATLTIRKLTFDTQYMLFNDGIFKYDGTAKAIAVSGTIPNGLAAGDAIIVNYTNNNKTEIGEHTVTATFTTSGNYNAIADKTAKLIITDKEIVEVSFADVSYVYDATEMSVTVSGLPAYVTAVYINNTRTNVGATTATVELTLDADKQDYYAVISRTYAILTITKATYDISGVTMADVTKTYDGNVPEVAINDTSLLPDGVTVSYNNDMTDAGTYTVAASFNGDYDNYFRIPDVTCTVTINKADLDASGVTLIGTDNASYTGDQYTYSYTTPQKIIKAEGTLPTGVESIAYSAYIWRFNSVTEQYYKQSVNLTTDWEGDCCLEDAGNYVIVASFVLTSEYAKNYNVPTALEANLIINRCVYDTVNWGLSFADATKDYNPDGNSLEIGLGDDNMRKYMTVTYEGSYVDGNGDTVTFNDNLRTEIGVYTIAATISFSHPNFCGPSEPLTATLTIVKADLNGTIEFNCPYYVYDGTEKEILISNDLPTGVTVAYENNKMTHVGSQTASAIFTVVDTDHYEAITTVTTTMAIYSVDFTFDDLDFMNKLVAYDGTEKSILVTGTVPEYISVTYTDNKLTEVGTTTATASFAATGDYENDFNAIPSLTAVLTVSSAILDLSSLTFESIEVPFDREDHIIAVEGLNVLETAEDEYKYYLGDNTDDLFAVTYYIRRGSSESYAYTVADIHEAFISCGTHSIMASFAAKDANYTTSVPNMYATVTIVPTVYDFSNFVFEDAAYEYGVTLDQLFSGSLMYEGDYVNIDGMGGLEVGVYDAVMTVSGNNCEQAYYTNSLTLHATITIVPTDMDMSYIPSVYMVKYDGDEHRFCENPSNLEDDMSFTFSSTMEYGINLTIENYKHTEIGVYEVVLSFTHDLDNYKPIPQMICIMQITGKEVPSVDITDYEYNIWKWYDGEEAVLTIPDGVLPEGITANYSDNRMTNAGSKEVIITFTLDLDKYEYMDLGVRKMTLEISAANVATGTYPTFDDATGTYDGTTHYITVDESTLPDYVVEVQYINNYLVDVGEVEATVNFITDDNHYGMQSMTATLTVTKADYDLEAISFEDEAFYYNGEEHSIYAYNMPNGMTATYSGNAKTGVLGEANEYDVTVTFEGDTKNYNAIAADFSMTATMTIIPKLDYDVSTFSFEDVTIVYDGSTHTLTGEGTLPEGVSVTYSANQLVYPGELTVTATFSGNYEVYNTIADMTATLTVNKISLSTINTFAHDVTVTYDGKAHSIDFSELLQNLPEGVTAVISDNLFVECGFHNVTVDLELNEDIYNAVDTINYYVSINRIRIDVSALSFNNVTYTYSEGTTYTAEIVGELPEYVQVVYQNNTLSEIGYVDAMAELSTTDDHYEVSMPSLCCRLTVTESPTFDMSGIVFQSKTVEYDGQEYSIDKIDPMALPMGLTVSYNGTGVGTNAGMYPLTATFGKMTGFEDYVLPYDQMNAILTINKKAYVSEDLDLCYMHNKLVKTKDSGYYDIALQDMTDENLSVYYIVFDGADMIFSNNTNYYTQGGVLYISTALLNSYVSLTVRAGVSLATQTLIDNYELAMTEFNATISLTDLEVYDMSGVTFRNSEVVYDGTAHSIAVSGELPEGVEVTYSANSIINVGKLRVVASFSGAEGYAAIDDMVAYITVTRLNLDLTTVEFNDTLVYNGFYQGVTVSSELPEEVSFTFSNNSKKDAGTYTVVATASVTGNNIFLMQNSVNITFVIEKADYTITVGGEEVKFEDNIKFIVDSFTYDGLEKSVKLGCGLPTGVTVTLTDATKTNAGTYTAVASFTGSANYKAIADASVSWTISSATADMSGISFSNKTVLANNSAQSIAITGDLPYGVTVSYTNNAKTDVGIYTVTASFTFVGTNYEAIDDMTATLTIVKGVYDMSGVSFADATYEFNGSSKTLTITGELPDGLTVKYSRNTLYAPGELKVNAVIVNGNANFVTPDVMRATLTVTAYESEVTWTELPTLTYDGNDRSSNVTATYVDVNGETQTLTVGSDNPFVDATEDGYLFTANEPVGYSLRNSTCVYYIGAAETTISENPTATKVNLGDAIGNSIISGGTTNTTGIFIWEDADLTVDTAPTYTATAIFIPYDEVNYGRKSVELTVDVHEHAYPEEWTVETAATCTTVGSEYKDCTDADCDERIYNEIPLIDHTYGEAVIAEATCTTAETHTYTCTVCGHVLVDVIGTPLGHSYEETGTHATCTEDGHLHYECTVCGDSYDVVEEALGHSYISTIVDPTCTEGGYTTHVCSVCEDTYTDNETAAIGHTIIQVEAEASTCQTHGHNAYEYCINCDYTTKVELPLVDHDFGDWEVFTAPTLTTAGSLKRVCSFGCGAEETHGLAALNTTDYSYSVVTAPTKDAEGTAKYACTVDGQAFEFEVVLAKLPEDNELAAIIEKAEEKIAALETEDKTLDFDSLSEIYNLLKDLTPEQKAGVEKYAEFEKYIEDYNSDVETLKEDVALSFNLNRFFTEATNALSLLAIAMYVSKFRIA